MTTPVVSDEFGRFKAGRWWWGRLDVEQAIGWGVREGCGGGRVGVNELCGGCSSGVEVGEVIKKEF